MDTIQTLKATRIQLVEAEFNSYDPDNFPGSKLWLANKKDAQALAEFDAAHPEIVAIFKAEKEAARQKRFDEMSDFARNGS